MPPPFLLAITHTLPKKFALFAKKIATITHNIFISMHFCSIFGCKVCTKKIILRSSERAKGLVHVYFFTYLIFLHGIIAQIRKHYFFNGMSPTYWLSNVDCTLEVVQGSKLNIYFTLPPQKMPYDIPFKKYFDFALSLIINFLEHIQVWYRLS